jgi:hypothetical protein
MTSTLRCCITIINNHTIKNSAICHRPPGRWYRSGLGLGIGPVFPVQCPVFSTVRKIFLLISYRTSANLIQDSSGALGVRAFHRALQVPIRIYFYNHARLARLCCADCKSPCIVYCILFLSTVDFTLYRTVELFGSSNGHFDHFCFWIYG